MSAPSSSTSQLADRTGGLRRSRLWLHFLDPEIDARFLYEWHGAATVRLRGIGIGILLILFAVWTGVSLMQPVGAEVWLTRIFTTAALLGFIAATYARGFIAHYQLATGIFCALLAVAILLPTFQHDAEHVRMSVLPVTILLCLGITGVTRIRFAGLLPLLLFVSAMFLYLAAQHPAFSRADVLLSSIWLLNTLALATMIGREIESQARDVFANRIALEAERNQLEIEHNRAETLLLNILPEPIAHRLKLSPTTIADANDHISVLFADIVGFTALSETLRPEVLVDMLNNLFQEFDRIARRHGVEKIKTIGDAYMAAAGVPSEQKDHCQAIANCALEMLDVVQHLKAPDGSPLALRIGIHTGPAIAGVIGAHKFAYDLWGDTVNMASRMESHGEPGRVQVSQTVYELLQHDYVLEPRGMITIKGKGEQRTWWLIRHRCSLGIGSTPATIGPPG